MTDTTEASDAIEQRLRWLIDAFSDPSALTEADIVAAYDVEDVWRDWSPAREIEFLTAGPHAASRPFTIERVTRGEENDATAVLVGADGKRFSLTCWTELEPPNRIVGARWVPAPPDGLTIRLATPEDGPALATLERRAPLRLGSEEPLTFMTFDHGDDYFAPSRLMEEVTIYVGEYDGRVVGAYCGAVQPVCVDGEAKKLFLEHHVRIDPDAPRGGVFWALCAWGRDRYARSTDSIAFYVSIDNQAVRKFVSGTPGWSVQPLRALLPCRPGEMSRGSAASAAEAPAIIAALNGAHDGAALFAPYTVDSLTDRLTRDAAQYSWEHVTVAGGAAIGVGRDLVSVTKERGDEVTRTVRATALDHGFAPGAEDDYRALLEATCARLAERGATHLAVYTSERSSTYDVVRELAEEIEVFDFWAFDIPEPAALAERGFYIDPIYF